MALFNAEGEMAKRGVQMTFLNHHVELKHLDRGYAEENVLHDSMALFIVGPFDTPRTKVAPQAEHIIWGAAHPKGHAKRQFTCGFPASSYVGQKPPAPKVPSLDGLNEALAQNQQAKEVYEPGDE